MYADDSVIKYACKTLSELQAQMQHDLNLISDWLVANKVGLNIDKSNYIIFSLTNEVYRIDLSLKNKKLEQVLFVKYLGLILSYNLKWTKHILMIKNKISPIIFALARIRSHVSEKTAWNIYYAYIYPHLNFMLPLWGKGTDSDLYIIKTMQNKCVKIIRKLDYLYPTNLIYDTKVLKLSSLTEYETILLIFKIKHDLLKCNITLPINSNIHNYPTRRRTDFHITTYRTKRAQTNVFYFGLKLYNELPNHIKSLQNLIPFKKALKIFILENMNS